MTDCADFIQLPTDFLSIHLSFDKQEEQQRNISYYMLSSREQLWQKVNVLLEER